METEQASHIPKELTLKTKEDLFLEHHDLETETENKIVAIINHPILRPQIPFSIAESLEKYFLNDQFFDGKKELLQTKGLQSLNWLSFLRYRNDIHNHFLMQQAFNEEFEINPEATGELLEFIRYMCTNQNFSLSAMDSTKSELLKHAWIERTFMPNQIPALKSAWDKPLDKAEVESIIKTRTEEPINATTMGDALMHIATRSKKRYLDQYYRQQEIDKEKLIETENEIRNKSNTIVPWQSLVREPEITSLNEISAAYLSNMADLAIFLRYSFNNNQFKHVLHNPQYFESWFRECHRIACTGSDGLSLYTGYSSMVNLSSEFPGKLRTTEILIGADIPFINKYFEIAAKYSEQIPVKIQAGDTWRKQGVMGGVLHDSEDDYETARFEFPPAEKVAHYLESMRHCMQEAYKLLQAEDKKEALKQLGKMFQLGIQGQITEAVLQSVLMSQINEMIAQFDMTRVSHDNLDGYAYVLEADHFADYFAQYVLGTKVPQH